MPAFHRSTNGLSTSTSTSSMAFPGYGHGTIEGELSRDALYGRNLNEQLAFLGINDRADTEQMSAALAKNDVAKMLRIVEKSLAGKELSADLSRGNETAVISDREIVGSSFFKSYSLEDRLLRAVVQLGNYIMLTPAYHRVASNPVYGEMHWTKNGPALFRSVELVGCRDLPLGGTIFGSRRLPIALYAGDFCATSMLKGVLDLVLRTKNSAAAIAEMQQTAATEPIDSPKSFGLGMMRGAVRKQQAVDAIVSALKVEGGPAVEKRLLDAIDQNDSALVLSLVETSAGGLALTKFCRETSRRIPLSTEKIGTSFFAGYGLPTRILRGAMAVTDFIHNAEPLTSNDVRGHLCWTEAGPQFERSVDIPGKGYVTLSRKRGLGSHASKFNSAEMMLAIGEALSEVHPERP